MEHKKLFSNSMIIYAKVNDKIISYPITTRSGLYRLTKDLARAIMEQNSYYRDIIVRTDNYEKLGGYFLKTFFGIDTNNCDTKYVFNDYIINEVLRIGGFTSFLVETKYSLYYGGKYRLHEDVFRFNEFVLDKKYKDAIRVCENCNNRFLDIALLPSEIVNHISSIRRYYERGDLGNDGVCFECCPKIICELCGEIIDFDDAINVEGDYLCEGCYEENVGVCECCGREFFYETGDYVRTNDGRYYCNWECAEDDGYWYDEDNEEWTNEENIISSYHSNDFFEILQTITDKPNSKRQTTGYELEMVGKNARNSDTLRQVASILKGSVYYENDGSVDVEMISQPMTKEYFESLDFKKAFDVFKSVGNNSHNGGRCGLHFHFNEEMLGYTTNQKEDTAKKICYFFEKYFDDLVKYSRRNDEQLHWCKKRNMKIDKYTQFRDLACDRYYAVNLTNMSMARGRGLGTIEIRITRGTLNENTFKASYDFLFNLVKNAKNITWKNADNIKLWFKGMKQSTLDYLKSRNAFTEYLA